jgi:hypothetical protein
MKITKTILIIISIIAVLGFSLFIYLAISEFNGDPAGWVQAAIAAIEIPIIVWGISQILKEIQLKPELDFGIFHGIAPDDYTDFMKKPLHRKTITDKLPTNFSFVILNKGKMTAEDVKFDLRYKQFGEKCYLPVNVHNPVFESQHPNEITNNETIYKKCENLNPGEFDYYLFEIYPNPLNKCEDQNNKGWELEFKVKIYSKELSSPKTGSVFIKINQSSTE